MEYRCRFLLVLHSVLREDERMENSNVVGLSRNTAPVESPGLVDQLADAVARRLSVDNLRSAVNLTFGDLFNRWLRDHATPHYSAKCSRNYQRMFNSYFQQWKDVRCYDIKRGDVQQWQVRLAENVGPTTANRARELMRMVFNRAIAWELLPDNYNPATKIRKFRTQSRERFLQADELPRFFEALKTLRYDSTRDCILMCLLTAQRVGNVREMRWDQIDFRRQVWTIPRTKNGTSHIVPLVPLAMAILDRRKVRATTEWVFTNAAGTGHITKLEKAWRQLLDRADIKDLRIHDLRRSHASWQAITGANMIAIAKTLNHRDLNSTAIYARLNVSEQRKAMVGAVDAMLAGIGDGRSDEF
jgi:integrase